MISSRGIKLLLILAGLSGTLACSGTQPCGQDGNSKRACEALPGCCWRGGDKDPCVINTNANMGPAFQQFLQENSIPKPNSGEIQKLKEASNKWPDNKPKNQNEQISTKEADEKVQERSISLFGPTGGFGGIDPIIASLAGFNFPKCPVDVKICHRIPCGGYNSYQYQDKASCYSNPLCCYDYGLEFYRRFFGPKYMGSAPLCFYGPTSRQWQAVTATIRPWNPWFTTIVLDLFESVFDTALINIQGNFACSLSFQKRTAEAKNKLQCSLRGRCWDDSSNYCYYPDDFAQQYFKDQQVYPELYTNDPSQAQCKNDIFDFGPSAYGRLLCSPPSPIPENIFELITTWCPAQHCCVNPRALSSDQALQWYLYSGGLGGGGIGGGFGNPSFPSIPSIPSFPNLGGGLPSLGNLGSLGSLGNLGGLGNIAGLSFLTNLNLTTFFCPYNFIPLGSGLPDLSEFVEGCCELPPCYHKKSLLGHGGGPIGPIPVPEWSDWGPCNAPCGQYGTQTRTCRYRSSGQPAQQGACPGSDTQQCFGEPCPSFGSWGGWQQSSQCSRTCGGGMAKFRATVCYVNGVPNPPQSGSCPGSGEEDRPCNQEPCPTQGTWGRWTQRGPCSVTCGTGTATFERTCYVNGQPSNPAYCPGSATQTRGCTLPPCPKEIKWGSWEPVTPCDKTCGGGTRYYVGKCYENGRVVAPSRCSGSQYQERPCNEQPCPIQQSYRYGEWKKQGPCGATCGDYGLQEYIRECYNTFTNQIVDVSSCSSKGPAYDVKRCIQTACIEHYVTHWREGSCRFINQRCAKTRSRHCYEQTPSGLKKLESGCSKPTEETIPCSPFQCSNQG